MNFKISKLISLSIILFSFIACVDRIEPDFSFSPDVPKAGQTVTFTNTTVGGEYWNWTFGDGGKSTLKNPAYTYKKPGIYDITLRADSNDNFIVTKQITVYDTVPSVYIEDDSVFYYKTSVVKVLAYNPYGYEVTYSWSFSGNAHSEDIVAGKSDKPTLEVYFSQRNIDETINLKITVGDSVYNISKTVFIHDVKSRSLMMAGSDGKVYRQRIFDNGLEEKTLVSGIQPGKHPFNIQALDNKLYIFDAGTFVGTDKSVLETKSGDGNIRRIDMSDNSVIEIIHNRDVSAAHGFYNGFIDYTGLYWTDCNDFVYKLNNINSPAGSFQWKGSAEAQTTVPYYLVKADRLGYYGNGLSTSQFSGGFYSYDNTFFWAKGGSGKGIYRFVAGDILTTNVVGAGTSPSLGAILRDFSIRAFDVDHINNMIYFAVTAPADKVGLWVSSIGGANPVRIDDAPVDDPAKYITGLIVDNASNRVYWAYRAPEGTSEDYLVSNPTHRTGVKYVRLAKSFSVDKDIKYFCPDVSAYGIAIDEVKK